jgi:hypothetical protein
MKPQVWLMVSNPTPRAYLKALTEDIEGKIFKNLMAKIISAIPGENKSLSS